MQPITMSMAQYDKFIALIEKIPNPNPSYYPSEQELMQGIYDNPKHFLRYLLWLEVTGSEKTLEEKEGKKRIKACINSIFQIH